MFRFLSPYHLEKFYAWTAALSLAVIVVCILGFTFETEKELQRMIPPKNEGIQIQFIESAPLSALPAKPVNETLSSKEIFKETQSAVVPLSDLAKVVVSQPVAESTTPSVAQSDTPQELAQGGSPTLVPAKFTPQEGGQFPDPLYPRWARQQNIQGSLMLLVTVQAEGKVSAVVVTESSGNTKLDAFASHWVRQQWIWPPGTMRSFLVPFVFQLK
ncbi:TonB family protein [bacterium]|nr:TonB family protein [Verrucomicrobiota bacterium]NBX01379.1 TonB family protein [bacterium]